MWIPFFSLDSIPCRSYKIASEYHITWPRRCLPSQGRRQLSEIGGGGGKIKIRGAKLKTSVELDPNSWIGLRRSFSENQVISKKKNHKFKRSFRTKAGDLQKKKKIFAKIRRLFLAVIRNFNVFSAQKQEISKKKGLRRNPKAFSGRNQKFKLFSGQKQQLFPPKKIPWGARNKSGRAKTKIGGAMPPCSSATFKNESDFDLQDQAVTEKMWFSRSKSNH